MCGRAHAHACMLTDIRKRNERAHVHVRDAGAGGVLQTLVGGGHGGGGGGEKRDEMW